MNQLMSRIRRLDPKFARFVASNGGLGAPASYGWGGPTTVSAGNPILDNLRNLADLYYQTRQEKARIDAEIEREKLQQQIALIEAQQRAGGSVTGGGGISTTTAALAIGGLLVLWVVAKKTR